MEYKYYGKKIVVRLDPGEEIITCMKELAKKENIHAAAVSGLGTTYDFEIGCFVPANKSFTPRHFTGDYEIMSLIGTLTDKRGDKHVHLHMTAGDVDCNVFGGHLKRGIVSVTCEIIVDLIDGVIERGTDEEPTSNRMRLL